MAFIRQFDPENAVVSCVVLISEEIIFTRDRRPEGHRADSRSRSRHASRSRDTPQAEKPSAIRREHDLLTILSPDRSRTGILEGELFRLATGNGQYKQVPPVTAAAPSGESHAQTVG